MPCSSFNASTCAKLLSWVLGDAAIMHLLLHVLGAQADSSYTDYFPIGTFFIVLAFHIFFFLQRVLGPLLTPTSAVATGGGSCCASAVPAILNKVGHSPHAPSSL